MSDQIQTGVGLLRPSSLQTFAGCQRRWAATQIPALVTEMGYDLRKSLPRHIGAAVGTGVHAGVAYTLEQKRENGDLGGAAEAENRAEAALVDGLQEGAIWDEATPSLPIAKTQAQRMVRSYRRHLAPIVAPLLVEQRLVADIGDGWHLSGQADTLAAGAGNTVRDLKTSAREVGNHALQLGAYGVIFQAHGLDVHGALVDHLPRVRLSAEQPPPTTHEIPLRHAVAEAWDTMDAIRGAVSEFQRRAADPSGRDPAGAFRANPSSSLCGEKWCPAFATSFCKITKRQ
jgi:hypothetical protein